MWLTPDAAAAAAADATAGLCCNVTTYSIIASYVFVRVCFTRVLLLSGSLSLVDGGKKIKLAGTAGIRVEELTSEHSVVRLANVRKVRAENACAAAAAAAATPNQRCRDARETYLCSVCVTYRCGGRRASVAITVIATTTTLAHRVQRVSLLIYFVSCAWELCFGVDRQVCLSRRLGVLRVCCLSLVSFFFRSLLQSEC